MQQVQERDKLLRAKELILTEKDKVARSPVFVVNPCVRRPKPTKTRGQGSNIQR